MLASSFRPTADLVALRTLLRHRAQLIEHRSPHVLHMQKALLQMNLQLSQALSDVTGETGQRILRAIVAGERDPRVLARLRDGRVKASEETIGKCEAFIREYLGEHAHPDEELKLAFDVLKSLQQAAAAKKQAEVKK